MRSEISQTKKDTYHLISFISVESKEIKQMDKQNKNRLIETQQTDGGQRDVGERMGEK